MKNTYSLHLLLLVIFCGMTATENKKRKISNISNNSNKKETLVTTNEQHDPNEREYGRNITFRNRTITEDDIGFENIDQCVERDWGNYMVKEGQKFKDASTIDIIKWLAKRAFVSQKGSKEFEENSKNFLKIYNGFSTQKFNAFEKLSSELKSINNNFPDFQIYNIIKEASMIKKWGLDPSKEY